MSSFKDEMFDIARKALAEQFANQMPEGYEIWRLEEYTPHKHKAPHLTIAANRNPKLRYIASIHGGDDNNYRAVTELGETAADAINACLAHLTTNH